MTVDDIFNTPRRSVPPFAFDDRVARVFDDMIQRSVPCYEEIIQRQVQLLAHLHQPGTCIYDLGCSTGNLGLGLCRHRPELSFSMKAVDSSGPMLALFKERLRREPHQGEIALQCQDIRQTPIENAGAVVLNYTLQFLPVADRTGILARVYQGLRPNGILLLCEKITHADATLAELQQTFYYRLKRENGYSELEISQKREALEKVLIPETVETHLQRLRHCGFTTMDVWLKWFNFAAFMAIKT